MEDRHIHDPSLSQAMAALEGANKIRSYRSALKKDIKAGRVNIPSLLADPPEMIMTMMVYTLLMAIPQFGHSTINNMLAKCHILPSTTVGQLTERQRDALLAHLRKKNLSGKEAPTNATVS